MLKFYFLEDDLPEGPHIFYRGPIWSIYGMGYVHGCTVEFK